MRGWRGSGHPPSRSVFRPSGFSPRRRVGNRQRSARRSSPNHDETSCHRFESSGTAPAASSIDWAQSVEPCRILRFEQARQHPAKRPRAQASWRNRVRWRRGSRAHRLDRGFQLTHRPHHLDCSHPGIRLPNGVERQALEHTNIGQPRARPAPCPRPAWPSISGSGAIASPCRGRVRSVEAFRRSSSRPSAQTRRISGRSVPSQQPKRRRKKLA